MLWAFSVPFQRQMEGPFSLRTGEKMEALYGRVVKDVDFLFSVTQCRKKKKKKKMKKTFFKFFCFCFFLWLFFNPIFSLVLWILGLFFFIAQSAIPSCQYPMDWKETQRLTIFYSFFFSRVFLRVTSQWWMDWFNYSQIANGMCMCVLKPLHIHPAALLHSHNDRTTHVQPSAVWLYEDGRQSRV